MIVGVPKETFPGETRVALTPAAAATLIKAKHEVRVEAGAGFAAGFTDADYAAKGVKVETDRAALIAAADVVLQVRTAGADPDAGAADTPHFRAGQVVVGHADPLYEASSAGVQALAARGVTLLAMELVPRITRAQAVDALSSQANIAGYKAVLMAAERSGKIFPMLMTAAGTIKPAKALILGVGVAGLQAIGTAKRLGALVSAYDIRPVVKEQVQSLGAKFVELPLDTADAQDKGGYAKAQTEEQQRKQKELLAKAVAESDVVVTTALIPGGRAPMMVSAEAVRGMAPGSVIVDLAAERGGNCELTKPGQTVVENGVIIIGALNVPATVPHHSSQMYAGNLVKMMEMISAKDGSLKLDTSDEVIAGMLVAKDGQVTAERVRKVYKLEPLPAPAPAAPAAAVPATPTTPTITPAAPPGAPAA